MFIDYIIKIDADIIKCVIVIQLGVAVLWLQSQAPCVLRLMENSGC